MWNHASNEVPEVEEDAQKHTYERKLKKKTSTVWKYFSIG
jgi:hypothetical protein